MSEYSKAFLTFWSIYPKKIGKGAAHKAWMLHKCDGKVADICKHLQVRVKRDKQWLDNGGKYVPMPTTFINQSRWEDEYETYAPKPSPAKPSALVESGPEVNDYVMKANCVMLGYIREHNGVPEAAMDNMIKNKNQFAMLMEEERPPEGSTPEVYKKLADESVEHLKRLYRSFDAIVEKHSGSI